MGKRPPSKRELARKAVQETHWPGSEGRVWPLPKDVGWCQVPRTLPLILEIMNQKGIAPGVDLSRTYLSLFCLNLGDGVVEVNDDAEMATWAGLSKKTWLARMEKLRELGFIQIAGKGKRRVGYVLMVHPVLVVQKLRDQGKVPNELWALFQQRHAEGGGLTPSVALPAFSVIPGGQGSAGGSTTIESLLRTTGDTSEGGSKSG